MIGPTHVNNISRATQIHTMPSAWLIVEALFPNLQPREAILTLVKPVVDRFQSSLETFHFFFEPNLLLRLKADEALLTNEVKPYTERMLAGMSAVNQSVRIDPHYTEQSDYGDGWELATKIFEMGSRSAMLRAEADAGNITLGPQFNEYKLTHLLLNQWGYSIDREAQFHFNKVGERLAMLSMLHHQRSQDFVERKLPSIIDEIRNRFLQEIVDTVERKMTES